jgi:hypothetical protein
MELNKGDWNIKIKRLENAKTEAEQFVSMGGTVGSEHGQRVAKELAEAALAAASLLRGPVTIPLLHERE